jgi:hypothetical protein
MERTVPGENATLTTGCASGCDGLIEALFDSSVGMSALEEARPQEGQKCASSADTAPQLEQLLIPWIVLSTIVRSIRNHQAVVDVSWSTLAQGRRKRGWPSFANARIQAGLWGTGEFIQDLEKATQRRIALQKRGPREKIVTDRRQRELTFDP